MLILACKEKWKKTAQIEKKCSQEDFYKFLKKQLDRLSVDEMGQEIIDELKQRWILEHYFQNK